MKMPWIQSEYKQRVRESSQWLAKGDIDLLPDNDRAAFQAWQTDKRNRECHEQNEQIWHDIAGLSELKSVEAGPSGYGQTAGDRSVSSLVWGGWKTPAKIPAFAALMGAVLFMVIGTTTMWDTGPSLYKTEIGEIREYVLADGTQVTMAAKSVMSVTMTDAVRQVVLTDGDAFFSVTKDPARPFVVLAGQIRVKVVGTRFNVHHGPNEVRVSVEEGRVNVVREPLNMARLDDAATRAGLANADLTNTGVTDTGLTNTGLTNSGLTNSGLAKSGDDIPRAPVNSTPLVLTTGQKVVAPHEGVLDAVKTIRSDEAGSWRTGRLRYNDVRLSEIISDANRYMTSEVILSDASIGALKLTTSFRVDETDHFIIQTLGMVLPVDVKQEVAADGSAKIFLHSRE